MTFATLEEIQRLQNLLGFAKRFAETGDLMDGIHEGDRFFGTVPSPETLKKMEDVNRLLDVLAVSDELAVQKFTEAKPHCRSAIAAVTVKGGLYCFEGTALKIFKKLIADADDIWILQHREGIRIALGFDHLWAEHIRLDDEEVLADRYNIEDEDENEELF